MEIETTDIKISKHLVQEAERFLGSEGILIDLTVIVVQAAMGEGLMLHVKSETGRKSHRR